MSEEKHRANYVGAPQLFNLNAACALIEKAYDSCPYLVGSSITRKNWRDVDVRLILDDEEFERRFPKAASEGVMYHALWSLTCTSISLWLSQQSGLPIDFQIQQMTAANKEFSRKNGDIRQALGIYHNYGGGPKYEHVPYVPPEVIVPPTPAAPAEACGMCGQLLGNGCDKNVCSGNV